MRILHHDYTQSVWMRHIHVLMHDGHMHFVWMCLPFISLVTVWGMLTFVPTTTHTSVTSCHVYSCMLLKKQGLNCALYSVHWFEYLVVSWL